MLTKEGLDKIQQLILSAVPIDGDHQGIALPQGMNVQDLDAFRDTKRRIQATYTTGSIVDFCAYLRTADLMSQSTVFVDMKSLFATAILDFGSIKDPGHCEHRAVINLTLTPEWRAMQDLDARKLSQADFIDWVIDWRDTITLMDADNQPLEFNQAIAALRKITLSHLKTGQSEIEQLHTSKTAMERIEAKYEGVTPGYLRFLGAPADDLTERAAVIRIDLNPDDAKSGILIKTRWMGRERLIQSIQQEFMGILKAQLAGSAAVFFGSIKC